MLEPAGNSTVLSMLPCACRQEDIDPALLEKEKEIELQKDDLKAKPKEIALKMVEGRVQKLAKVSLAPLQSCIKFAKRSDSLHGVCELCRDVACSSGMCQALQIPSV